MDLLALGILLPVDINLALLSVGVYCIAMTGALFMNAYVSHGYLATMSSLAAEEDSDSTLYDDEEILFWL